MYHVKSLSHLGEGETGIVSNILSTGSIRRRLQDIEGTNVKCMQKSPSGDPVAYNIRGAVIALRTEDSGNILIEMN